MMEWHIIDSKKHNSLTSLLVVELVVVIHWDRFKELIWQCKQKKKKKFENVGISSVNELSLMLMLSLLMNKVWRLYSLICFFFFKDTFCLLDVIVKCCFINV